VYDAIVYDAIIVAGGRASRLGGIDKTSLEFEGISLIRRALDAVETAARICVVGGDTPLPLPARVERARESPPWGGPAAAIAAGIAALLDSASPFTAVTAGDLPRVGAAMPALLAASAELPDDIDGVLAVDGSGRRQPLLAIYHTAALRRAVDVVPSLENLPVRRLLETLTLRELALPDNWCTDIDTPEDAAGLGIAISPRSSAG